MKKVNKIFLSGAEVYPIVEGGKGIGASNGETAGAFAANDAVGTISGVFPPGINKDGLMIPLEFKGSNRKERSKEIINYSIEGSIREIKKAYEISKGRGRIHLNILWGIAGAEEIIEKVLENTRGMLHGITCGAGMPYRLSSYAKKYGVYYYPIISSARAFTALWSRAYKEVPEFLGGLVYEDPWKAGGHNGLSNKEDPFSPEDPYLRVKEIRDALIKVGLPDTPIVMAGGVWNLKKYESWIDNKEIGPIAFQLGTRPLLTMESPISNEWKQKLLNTKKGDVILNNYSSTGFYSSAINNDFLKELKDRAERQIPIRKEAIEDFTVPFHKSIISAFTKGNKNEFFIKESDRQKLTNWVKQGFTKALETPESTALFVSPEKANKIKKEQRDCKGCLAACKFSSWATIESKNFTTGLLPDPRSFCIFNTLQNLICGENIENQLLFSGHNTFMFSEDSLYKNGHIPSIKELINKLLQGE